MGIRVIFESETFPCPPWLSLCTFFAERQRLFLGIHSSTIDPYDTLRPTYSWILLYVTFFLALYGCQKWVHLYGAMHLFLRYYPEQVIQSQLQY